MGGLSLSNEAMRREQLLNMSMLLLPKPKRYRSLEAVSSLKALLSSSERNKESKSILQHVSNVVTGLDEIAIATYHSLAKTPQPFWPNLSTGGWSQLPRKDRIYDVFEVLHQTEQAPHPDNRVVLGEELDKLGRRKARMQTRWRDADIDSIRRSQTVFAQEIARAGLGRYEVELNGELPVIAHEGTSHHMGTTRMDVDPKQGIVDENCRVHSVSNLYIASSSVFPTGGYANPTLTIVALATRLADRVKSMMLTGETIAREKVK
jgi:choline dehydrogenase-like flavoprotein